MPKLIRMISLLTCTLLLPMNLFGAESAGDIKIWPLFYHASDPVSAEARTEILWPLYVRQYTTDYTANQFLSFSQTFPPHYPNQYYLFWPFGGVRSGHGHDAWLFPVLWSGAAAGGDKRSNAVFPLYYFGKDRDDYSLNIAILQHNAWDPTSRFNMLFPLLWLGTTHTDTVDQFSLGLLPLGWTFQETVQEPANSSESNSGGLFLINWWRRYQSATKNDDGVEEKETFASDGVFPVFRRTESFRLKDLERDRKNSFWLFPYYQTSKDTASKKTDAAFENIQEDRHLFFPLWWDHSLQEDQTLGFYRLLFPFWWHSGKNFGETVEESSRFLVPVGAHFYKRGEYETHNLMGPVLNRTENTVDQYVRYDAFFPFFSRTMGKDLQGGRIFPFLGWETLRGKYDNLWYAFPLGWRTESQEEAPAGIDSESFWALHKLEERPYTDRSGDFEKGPRCATAFYPFFWSTRRADVQKSGLFPFYGHSTRRMNRDMSTTTTLPLFLSELSRRTRDDIPVYTRHDYLLSILAWARGEDYKFSRFFPLFSYLNTRERFEIFSLCPPFSYVARQDNDHPETNFSSDLFIPLEILPIYQRSVERAVNRTGDISVTRKSWFFPFYKYSQVVFPESEKEELSILWPLWNGEWENNETRIRGIGGVTNFYEKDANGFVEQRILYRLFTRKTRSWFSELELMPFYAQQYREDGTGYWKFLGGFVGKETRADQSYLRLCYFPIRLGEAKSTDQSLTVEQQNRHADLALNYVKHKRHDRAAIEFALSGNARADDPDFQDAAGDAYLNTVPGKLGEELRSTLPLSLKFLGGKYETENTRDLKKRLRHQSIDHFKSAIRLGADQADMLKKIAQAYVDLNEPEKALETLTDADKLSPQFDTAMARLITLDRMMSNQPAEQSDADKDLSAHNRNKLLTEIKRRYPESPSVLLYEAETLLSQKTRHSYRDPGEDAAIDAPFSETTMKQLGLYMQGNRLPPVPPEKAWLEGAAFFSVSYWHSAHNRTPPDIECALRAVSILGRQVSRLSDDNKRSEAAALFPLIQELLPRFCDACMDQGTAEFDCFGRHAPLSRVIHALYDYYVEAGNDPSGYLETAEAWAAPLCPDLRQAIDRLLDNVRFENQYIKTWRITPVAGIEFSAVNHANAFNDRYINLDAILGHPDNCTVNAECVIVSAEDQSALLRIGFDHALSAALNNKLIFEEKSRKIAVRDEFTVSVVLKKGANHLKLTVSDNSLSYGFFARLSDAQGNCMKNVQIQPGFDIPAGAAVLCQKHGRESGGPE